MTPVTYTTNTDVGTAGGSASYAGDANHLGSTGSATFTIEKATSTTVVSCAAGPFTYTGSAQTPCSVSVTGVGSLSLTPAPTYLDNVNAGTATASYAYAGDGNHTGSSDSKTFTIAKATSATVITCLASVTFDGSPQTPCSVTVTGASLSLTPPASYTNNVNAGTATASYTFAGDANHEGSNDTKTFTIAKASSTTAITCPASVTFTGSPLEPCSVAITGAGGLSQTATPTYTNNSNAGTASVSYSFAGDANHEASSDSRTFTIAQAPSTTTVTCIGGPFTYTGSPQTPCGVSVTGVGGLSQTPSPIYANNVHAGTATASYSFGGDANHYGSTDSKTFSIAKASSTVTVTCAAGPFVYGGSAQTPCSASVSGVGLSPASLTVQYSNNINAGTATATATYAGDADHNSDSDSQQFTIDKAPTNVLLNNLVQPVNNVQSPTATATPVGSSTPVNVTFTFTYTVGGSPTQTRPTEVGVYPLSVDIVSTANYTGHADGYFVIYDPTGGFVTGGGWIVAAAESCVQGIVPGVCTGATGGRANFGFVSKYARGATTPSGNTEFQFQAGNLNFKSTSYQWLVVSGARAQFKGSGSINGQSGYDFILTAVDGALPGGNNQDAFRIKITYNGSVVFDNQQGAMDSDPLSGSSTALVGGSISIKSK